MAKGFAVEFAHLTKPAGKIRCNSVSPGYTDTILSSFVPVEQRAQWWGLTPVGREALPQEIVGAICTWPLTLLVLPTVPISLSMVVTLVCSGSQ